MSQNNIVLFTQNFFPNTPPPQKKIMFMKEKIVLFSYVKKKNICAHYSTENTIT